ncbi:MAG: hypothetical protein CO182_03620, partial [Lysobacterales bacterium CG_4_9_14_3_um_filter_62_6]
IVEYVGTHGSASITEQLNAVYGVESSSLDEVLQQVQSRTLSHETW